MQYKLIGTACVALLICGGIAHANVDFDRLVASLSYADDQDADTLDAVKTSEELPAPNIKIPSNPLLPEATRESYDQLQSLLPSDLSEQQPLLSPLDAPALDAPTLADDLRSIPELPKYDPEGNAEDSGQNLGHLNFQAPNDAAAAPEPYQPLDEGYESVDLQMLANAVTVVPANPGIASPPSVLDFGCSAPKNPAAFHQCGYCNPVTPPCLAAPILPPPADKHSLYRTPACYRGIWAGYEAQKQLECSKHHRHIHGTCDCERKSRCNCAGCQAH